MTEDEILFPGELRAAIGLLSPAPENGGAVFSSGRHRSPFHGDSSEFQDFRAYTPGDDLRRIDWNIFRRTRKLLLRQYRNFPHRKHLIVLDNSPSVRFRPERARAAWRIAALLGGTLLDSGDEVALRITGDRRIRSFAPGGRSLAPFLGALEEAFRRDSSGEVPPLRPPRGPHCWIVSDFLDPEGLEHLEHTLHSTPGFTPVRIFEEEEKNPAIGSELRLIDAESGGEVVVSPDRRLLERYRERLVRFERLLEIPARRIGSRVHAFDVALSVPELIDKCARELFAGGRR